MPRGKGIDEMMSWWNNAPGCAHLALIIIIKRRCMTYEQCDKRHCQFRRGTGDQMWFKILLSVSQCELISNLAGSYATVSPWVCIRRKIWLRIIVFVVYAILLFYILNVLYFIQLFFIYDFIIHSNIFFYNRVFVYRFVWIKLMFSANSMQK